MVKSLKNSDPDNGETLFLLRTFSERSNRILKFTPNTPKKKLKMCTGGGFERMQVAKLNCL